MSVDYQICYERLEIESPIDWKDLNRHYRKLVQIWHPDRYAGADPETAETKFIELTKAFSTLRDYYNAHNKLPTLITEQHKVHDQLELQQRIHSEGMFSHATDKHKKQNWFTLTPFARRVLIQGTCCVFVAVALLTLFWNMEKRNRERLVDEKHIVNSSTADTLNSTGKQFKSVPVVLPGQHDASNDL